MSSDGLVEAKPEVEGLDRDTLVHRFSSVHQHGEQLAGLLSVLYK